VLRSLAGTAQQLQHGDPVDPLRVIQPDGIRRQPLDEGLDLRHRRSRQHAGTGRPRHVIPEISHAHHL
jgi:hypothetical protein